MSSSFFSENITDLPSTHDVDDLEQLALLARGDTSLLMAEIRDKSQKDLKKFRKGRICLQCRARFTMEENLQFLN